MIEDREGVEIQRIVHNDSQPSMMIDDKDSNSKVWQRICWVE